MDSWIFSKTNGYLIFCGNRIPLKLVGRIVDLMMYRKRSKVFFYDGESFSENIDDVESRRLILCYFPFDKSSFSNALVHGRIFDVEQGLPAISAVREAVATKGLGQGISLDVDGDFSMAFVDRGYVIALRSPVSSKPLYLSREGGAYILAGDRYPLDLLGLHCNYVPAGSIVHMKLSEDIRVDIKRYYTANVSYRTLNLEDSVEMLRSALKYSVAGNLEGVRQVAAAFSGGLDSTVLVELIKSLGVKPFLFTVCSKGSYDSVHSRRVADILSLDHFIFYVDEAFLRERLSRLTKVFGKANVMDLTIALIFNVVAEEAARMGLEHVVVGQGADELFGGYQRYLNILRTYGNIRLETHLKNDLEELQGSKILRDDVSISMYAEPIMPFLNKKVVEAAYLLPVEFKIDRETGERKVVLRALAKKLGLAEEIYLQSKKAMQYSSGLQKMISKIVDHV
ncbi:MAG: asparagine synthase-related protein [Nitrososphaeria archaeon]